MPTFTIESPKCRFTAPDGWDDVTHENRDVPLSLERNLDFVKSRNGPGIGGNIELHAHRCPKGAETRITPKALLKLLLNEGKVNKWGEPYDIVCEEKPLRLAAVSFTFRYDKHDYKRYLRFWHAVKGRTAIRAVFSPDSFYLTPQESAIIFEECESTVRSLEAR